MIIEDKTKIKRLYFPDETYVDGDKENAEIIPYHENGEMASVVWFKVMVDGKIVRRINSKYVLEVMY